LEEKPPVDGSEVEPPSMGMAPLGWLKLNRPESAAKPTTATSAGTRTSNDTASLRLTS
jgi:hypothetical protein